MLNVFVIFSECISMLVWLHIGFRRNVGESKGKTIFCILYILYYYLASVYEFITIVDIIPMLLIWIWVKIQFKEKTSVSIMKIIISIVGIYMTQLISLWLMGIMGSIFTMSYYKTYICGNIINLMFSVIVYLIFLRAKLNSLRLNLYFISIVVYIICLITYIKYCFRVNGGLYGGLYLALISSLIFSVLIAIKGVKYHYELEQKRIELEMSEKYEEVYSMLLVELRLKQHDYKNQIAALYSIQMVDESKKELLEIQKTYGDRLLQEARYDNLILGCSNPVLSGYVYTKCNEAERAGIRVEPSIMCSNKNYNIGIHQIIEILGILINNAIEYFADKDWDYKVIKINVFEKLDKLQIEVANVAEYVSYDKLDKMFSFGYSTKGDGRGIGLYSLKNIVKKHNGEIIVENELILDINWFKVRMSI